MTESLIERLARTLHEFEHPHYPWEQQSDYTSSYGMGRVERRKQARKVLEAMREATGDMTQADADTHPATRTDAAYGYAISCQDILDVWEAMIDAALAEDKP